MGLGLPCRVSAWAMRCVLPQPAGALILARSIARMSISSSGIAGPDEDAGDQGGKAGFRLVEVGSDDVACSILHPRHRFEPTGLSRPGRPGKDGAVVVGDSAERQFRLD